MAGFGGYTTNQVVDLGEVVFFDAEGGEALGDRFFGYVFGFGGVGGVV